MASAFDFMSSLLDEVALEGLDGITLEMLWYRLGDRPNFPIALDEDSKSYLWDNIAKHKDIEIYALPEPRKYEPPYNRYDHIDSELGVVMESHEEIYDPYFPIVGIKEGEVRGSCPTYETRKCITSDVLCGNDVLLVSYSQAREIWGDSLVLVASPKVRLLALIGTEANPLIDISLEAYCLLERVGRSRYLGEVTQGAGGLLALKALFCKQLHYHRKKLSLKALITKQTHYMKTKKGSTSNGCLFHLTRFHVQRHTKMMVLMKRLCDILQDKPEKRESCMALREEMDVKDTTFKKLFYRPFQRWIKFLNVSCKEFYPNATKKDWFTVAGNEKFIKVVQLLRHCDDEVDEEEDIDDGKDKAVPLNVYFDCSKIYHTVPLVNQIYRHIKASGPEGISAADLGRIVTLPRLDIRGLLRLLIKKNHILTVLQDRGRQKVTKYICKTFEHQNELVSSLKEQEDLLAKEAAWAEEEEEAVYATLRSVSEEWNNDAPPSKKRKPNEIASENDMIMEMKTEKAKSDPSCESNYQNIISQVLELRNSQFTGRTSEVQIVDRPFVKPKFASTKQLTVRKLKRSSMILDFLKSERFTTLGELQKYVVDKEKEEGYSFKIDKKSIARLVYSLYTSKRIKIFKAILKLENQQTEIEYLCDNSLQPSDPRIQVAVEQAKFKHFGVSKDNGSNKKPQENEEQNENKDQSKTTKSVTTKVKTTKKTPQPESQPKKTPLVTPKFGRCKCLHQFLYYLVYQHKGTLNSGSEQVVYHESMTWKRFVPPLPDYGKPGWCFLTDVYSCMPLSLFVKIINFKQGVSGLNTYLENEEKTHYLVKFLPQDLRNSLMGDRRYLFGTNDVIVYLCYMGILSIGPQVRKMKDQIFLYVHKNASIKDTTISTPGYMHINPDLEYDTKSYKFESEDEVENYWLEMESVTFHTPLGKFNSVIGQTIALTHANYKPDLAETTKNKSFDSVQDIGTLPGDGLGAGGFDSALFMHSRRNWQSSCNSNNPVTSLNKSGTKPPFTCSIQHLLKTKKAEKPELRSRLQRMTRNFLLPQKENEAKVPKLKPSLEKICAYPQKLTKRRKKTILRTVQRRLVKKRMPYYDEKDKTAMKKMDKSRCDWTTQEDSFLLLCKVASCFLDPSYPKLCVPYTIIRDLLQQHVPVSCNKSSRACQRRVRYMMMNPTTASNVHVFLGEALQDTELVKEFDRFKPPKSNEDAWRDMFTSVVKKLLEKFTLPPSDRCRNILLPDTMHEFHDRFEHIMEHSVFRNKGIYKSPESVDDISRFILVSLVLSALALESEGTEWTKLLHRLYQTYTESDLKLVVTKMRKERIIAVKKRTHRTDLQRSLRSTCPYKFSITYCNAMLTKFPPKIFKEANVLIDTLKKLSRDNIELKGDVPPGYAAAVLSLVTMQQLFLHTQIPEQIILFDSSLSKEARSSIVERMINTLTDTESVELSRLLNEDSGLTPANNEKVQELSLVISESEMMSTDLSLNEDLSLVSSSQTSEVQRSSNASRFALYLLRQEMSQPPIERAQHSQDYIVLNACRVFCRLKPSNSAVVLQVNPPEVIEKTNEWHKTSEAECIAIDKMMLTKQHTSEISRFLTCYFPPEAFNTNPNHVDTLELVYDQYSPQTLLDAQCMFDYIYNAGSKGISEKDLWVAFKQFSGELSIFEHLGMLREAFLVIRAGIVEFTYVCGCFASCWVLKSFLLADLNKTNRRPASSDVGKKLSRHQSKLPLNVSENKKNAQCSNNINTSNHFDCVACKLEKEPSNDTKTLNGQVESIPLNPHQTRSHSATECKRVYFLPRTWRHPDGTLNKPVFFELLTTILSHIVGKPGSSTFQICKDFLLVLPPVQTLELIEILEKACCIYKYYCKPMKKGTLFSTLCNVTITENPGPEDLDHLEPFPDAVCKMAELRDAI